MSDLSPIVFSNLLTQRAEKTLNPVMMDFIPSIKLVCKLSVLSEALHHSDHKHTQ